MLLRHREGMAAPIKILRDSIVLAALATSLPAFAQKAGHPFEAMNEDGRSSFGENAAGPRIDDTVLQPFERLSPPHEESPVSEDVAMVIGAINIRGIAELTPSDLAASYERFIGQNASAETLRNLTNSIAAHARERGYIFASAQIPAQAVRLGIVTVELDIGQIDEVRIVGTDNDRLRKTLAPLVGGNPHASLIERQLLLAGELPGISIARTDYLREGGAGVLVVEAREIPAIGYAALDNFGSARFGPIRARLRLDLNGIFADDDSVTVHAISTIAQPREMVFVNARYARTLGDGATVIGIAASAGLTRGDSNLRGHNRYAAIFASNALVRGNAFNLWLNGELAYLNVSQAREGVPFEEDDLVTASVNFAANANIGIGRIYGGIGATRGLAIGGTTEVGDPLASRANGSARFTRAFAWFDSALDLGTGFGLRIAANGQIASRPLLSSQEFSIGGPYSVRGYDFSERFGDEGIAGLVELRKDFDNPTSTLDWLQLYTFLDGGYARNIGTGFGGGTLVSAGGGLRARLDDFDFAIEAATPLTNIRLESADKSPQINLHTGLRF